jgi:hypothetical protein
MVDAPLPSAGGGCGRLASQRGLMPSTNIKHPTGSSAPEIKHQIALGGKASPLGA